MGVRFNKRIKLLPYVVMNVGKSGMSLTIGPKGKTLNIGSTGVNVNVSMGQGVGYSKRLITWKKLNILSWLGLGGKATAATKDKGKKSGKTTDISLDEAIAEAGAQQQAPVPATQQQGCSWGCILAAIALLIIIAMAGVIAYLLLAR